ESPFFDNDYQSSECRYAYSSSHSAVACLASDSGERRPLVTGSEGRQVLWLRGERCGCRISCRRGGGAACLLPVESLRLGGSMGGKRARSPGQMGLQSSRRVEFCRRANRPALCRQLRSRTLERSALVRRIRSRIAGARAGMRGTLDRSPSPERPPYRLFSRQRGGMVEYIAL